MNLTYSNKDSYQLPITQSGRCSYRLITTNNPSVLPVVELCREYNAKTMFGGQTLDALRANVWVPAGKAISTSSTNISLVFEYGDTWYSRYDCLKTYPYTNQDEN